MTAPDTVVSGKPITARFESDQRLSGRLRLTVGTESVVFTLVREGRDPVTSAGPRVRGKQGTLRIIDWGEYPAGTELVLRFEGAKAWMRVVDEVEEPA